MSDAHAAIPDDPLASTVSPEDQRQAAMLAQEVFGRAFRLSLDGDAADLPAGVARLEAGLRQWADTAAGDDARSLRLALLVTGLDQWGVAYSRAFGLAAIPALSGVVGALRTGLDPRADARFLRQFAAIDAAEHHAIDFKVELRRGIHLALWHAMIACETVEDANRILSQLGGMMVALVQAMPAVGWRLLADALAHIQIRCLADGLAAEGVAQEANAGLFDAVSRNLEKDVRDRIFAHAAQAVVAWQRARRPGP